MRAAFVYVDGHAAYRKFRALRSGDFGLTPDQLYSQTNEIKPDGGGVYTARF